jgi:hypothetical protein
LWQERHPDTRCKRNLSTVRLNFTTQNSQQRRFASAIPPEQADPLPRLNLARDAIQKRRPTETNP